MQARRLYTHRWKEKFVHKSPWGYVQPEACTAGSRRSGVRDDAVRDGRVRRSSAARRPRRSCWPRCPKPWPRPRSRRRTPRPRSSTRSAATGVSSWAWRATRSRRSRWPWRRRRGPTTPCRWRRCRLRCRRPRQQSRPSNNVGIISKRRVDGVQQLEAYYHIPRAGENSTSALARLGSVITRHRARGRGSPFPKTRGPATS